MLRNDRDSYYRATTGAEISYSNEIGSQVLHADKATHIASDITLIMALLLR